LVEEAWDSDDAIALEGCELIVVEHKLLVTDREPAFEPTRRVQHEVDAAEHRGLQGVGRLVSRLRALAVEDTAALVPSRSRPRGWRCTISVGCEQRRDRLADRPPARRYRDLLARPLADYC
jgi:hypothetical protein